VSHNYARRHYYNLWFTLTVPDAADAGQVAAALLPGTALDEILLLPAVRFFKLDARFALGEEPAAEGNLAVPQDGGTRFAPTLLDRQAIHWLGQDLPLEERPFAALAEQAGLSEEALLERAQFYLREGIMRRYGAVLNHRRAGFSANGMTGWIVPAARVEAVGQLFAGYREVSHCYERPTYPGWPYNVFTMIHAATEQDVEAIVGRMAQAADVEQYAILFSTKEFKKKPISFFTVRLGFMGFKPHQVPGKRW
jgi:DNA-binding Lrp family transcriptional regulator